MSKLKEKLQSSSKILIGLGEEWRLPGDSAETEARKQLLKEAYNQMYQWLVDKDYFIVTMATDALIYDSSLGSNTEFVHSVDSETEIFNGCPAGDEKTMAMVDKMFPPKVKPKETRWQRIVAPCGNETWRQCSRSCTKDIWEPGEIPDDICPHCGAPLTGNTIDAPAYIEEGYLPQWQRYTQWLAGTLNQELLILELGVGFDKPGVIRFPFEKTAFFNQKSFMIRVHHAFPQLTEELSGRGEVVLEDSVQWVLGGQE